MDINKDSLEKLIREIIAEKIGGNCGCSVSRHGVISVNVPSIRVNETNRLDTGVASDRVYTKDLFTLEQSPRLGCGIMEMSKTAFDWTLSYDEVDYVIEGTLSIIIDGDRVTANKGELILIPKGSKIKFSVDDYARFIYVTYPADWQNV